MTQSLERIHSTLESKGAVYVSKIKLLTFFFFLCAGHLSALRKKLQKGFPQEVLLRRQAHSRNMGIVHKAVPHRGGASGGLLGG